MARRPAWKPLAFVLAGLLALLGLFFAWVQSVASRRWAEIEKRVPLLIAEARGRDPRRPVLRGEAVPGNAWTDYNPAVAGAKALPKFELGEFMARGPKADRAKVEAAVAANGALLDGLQAGARRSEGTYPLQFEKGFATDIPGLVSCHNLSNLAVCKARLLREAGKEAEARGLLLDAAQFAGDLGRNNILLAEMVSLAMLASVFEELKALPPDPELARSLAVLDGAFPSHGESMLNEAACMGAGIVATPDGLAPDVGALAAWRYGFSPRLLLVDAWTTHERMMKKAAVAAEASWDEARRIAAELDAELAADTNPISQIGIPGLMGSHRAGRERRAQLRLLRRYHGEAGPLDDPFGAKLLTDGAKVWSVGPDGVDDAGKGDWKSVKTGDIVLELPKK